MPGVDGLSRGLKVLHVIPAVAFQYGGPSQAIYTTCRSLMEEGIDVLIATTNADGKSRVLPVSCGVAELYQGVPTIFFARQCSEAFKYSWSLARWLEHHVADFDVVHIHAVFSHACISAGRACQKGQVPYLVRPMGMLDPWSLKQKWFRKWIFLKLVGKRMLEGAAAIHYTTVEEQRLVETGFGATRGRVIPNGIDLHFLRQPTDVAAKILPQLGSSPYVLTLSRIHPKKRIELLIQAFAAVKDRGRSADWHLVIAGDGEPEYVNRLKELALDCGLRETVHFVGWLEGERKVGMLRGASLMVMPSYQENFGISLVEGMALGVPVLVSSGVNLAPEILAAGAGWVVEQGGANLTAILEKVLRDPAARRSRGERGRHFAMNYDAGAIAIRLINLYRMLIAKSAVSGTD